MIGVVMACLYLVPQLSFPGSQPLVPTAFVDGASRVGKDAIALWNAEYEEDLVMIEN